MIITKIEDTYSWYMAKFNMAGRIAIGHGNNRVSAIRSCLNDMKIVAGLYE